MTTETRKFQVGVFVIGAATIAVVTLIWLGASHYFADTETLVTYFSESIQGLDSGSAVKYRGVPAGRVARVGIAPDGDLIEVILDLDRHYVTAVTKDPSLRATLELSGITGLRYVEIERRAGPALEQMPPLSFKPPYEVIPSARSSFKAIQSALGDVYERFIQMDLPGVALDARHTLAAAQQLLTDQRIDAVLTNLKGTTEATNQLAKNLEAMTANVALAPVVANATQASTEAKRLFTNLNQAEVAQKVAGVIEQIQQLTFTAQQAVVAMQAALERLDRTVGEFRNLAQEVRTQPSRLLFSAPPEQRRGQEATP